MSAENVNNGPSFEVPRAPETQPTPEKTREQGLEQGGPAREAAPRAPAQAAPPAPVPQMPIPQDPASPAQTDTATPASPTDLPAEDVDLIEKVWVQKAKHIVAETHDDPYKQKNQISKVKADYIQKRFNKSIKVDDATSA